VLGMIAGVRAITTKKGDRMAFVTLEDMNGACDVTVFPKTYEASKEILVDRRIVLVRGKIDVRNDKAGIIADSITDKLPVRADSVTNHDEDILQEPEPDYNILPPPPDDFDPDEEEAFIANELSWTPTYGATTSSTKPASASPTNGSGKKNATSQSPSKAETIHRTLHIRFPLTEDAQADVARLDEILALLGRFAGEDRFTITIFDAHDQIRVIFPQGRTGYCSDLVAELQRLLGEDCLSVERERDNE